MRGDGTVDVSPQIPAVLHMGVLKSREYASLSGDPIAISPNAPIIRRGVMRLVNMIIHVDTRTAGDLG